MDDLRYAREIELGVFRQRSWIQRVAEWGADPFARLL